LWALHNFSTSFALNMLVYIVKRESETHENIQGERVVWDKIEVITGSGRNVTLDKLFIFSATRRTEHLLSRADQETESSGNTKKEQI